jgi:hypothetical protein
MEGLTMDPRQWTVSYTAKRKRTIYERQTVTVTVTEKQYYEMFGLPAPADPLTDDGIEMLAFEHGKSDESAWTCYADDSEGLDEDDFEITEGE